MITGEEYFERLRRLNTGVNGLSLTSSVQDLVRFGKLQEFMEADHLSWRPLEFCPVMTSKLVKRLRKNWLE
jgi:hypothetical protein